MLLITAISFAQSDLTRGLIAYYPFNGNADDESGNGRNGMLRNGVQLTSDKYGNANSAYQFDGIDDYIEISDDPKLRFRDSFSICISYMKLSAPGGNLIEKRSVATGFNSSFSLAAGSLGANAAVKTDGNCNDAESGWSYTGFTQPPVLNQWYCLVVTFKSGTLNFYQDGVLISSSATLGNRMDSCDGSNIRLGYHLSFDPIWMHGKIDEVRLYDRDLNVSEVQAYCDISSTCNNWLRIPEYNTTDYVSIGDLDVTGNQITVEALFNADTNYFIPSTVSYDLVSKHATTSNCNYLLRPVTAEITTSNGFYQVIGCDYAPKVTHHVALVYDGSTLKFYRNGHLLGSKPASGNLVTNNLATRIGNFANGTELGSLKGYINEVRIWNVARTGTEISTFMNTSLPNPTTQTGLLAYYVFDNLLNKQGNTAWNGVLNGGAVINSTNPSCTLSNDSCLSILPVTISSFVATGVDTRTIQLTWTTEEESGIERYIIQRSKDERTGFIDIAAIDAYDNNSIRNTYSYKDINLEPNRYYYYRIQVIEKTGARKFSTIRSIKSPAGSFDVLINTNPVKDVVNFQTGLGNGRLSLEVFNNHGALMQRKEYTNADGTKKINIGTLPAGIYYFVFRSGTNRIVKQIIKQ